MLMSKLTFCRDSISSLGSMPGMVSSQADTYMMGAERKVLNTIPEVTCTAERNRHRHTHRQDLNVIGYV